MSRTEDIFQEIKFAKVLIDSFPCGVLIVDINNNILAANNIIENVLNTSEESILGRGGGEALKCIHAIDSPKGCGFSVLCKGCDMRKLAMSALSSDQKHRARTQLQIVIDGQISAVGS